MEYVLLCIEGCARDVDHFVCFSVFLQCSEPEKDLAKILNETRRLTTAR